MSSESARDYRLRTQVGSKELIVRQLGAQWEGGDTRRIELFVVSRENPNPDAADRIHLNPHQAEALVAAIRDHLLWKEPAP